METLKFFNFLITGIFFICYIYQFLYIPVPLLKKTPPHKEAAPHRYAVLICARNEAAVIADLLQSIRAQTYDQTRISVFVMADNCTDQTAQIAQDAGATVFERFNNRLVGKGYALEQLLRCVEKTDTDFDGYFVFDADNILEPDYIEQMNRTFSDGYEIVTSYRNSKNFGENWISAGYSLWFLRESRFLNHARMLLGVSCAVSGTGFLFSRRILSGTNGWRFYLLTEDIEFSVYHILNGEKIGFCPDAVLYDEQPVGFRQSCRQRLRWAKGYLQVFRVYGVRLLRGAVRGNFSCFDMTMAIMPAIALTAISIFSNVAMVVVGVMHGDNLRIAVQSILQMLLNMYLLLFVIGGVTTVSEWKRIHTSVGKKALYTLTFPLFMFTYIPISFAAIFAKVKWTPVEHRVTAAMLKAETRTKSNYWIDRIVS